MRNIHNQYKLISKFQWFQCFSHFRMMFAVAHLLIVTTASSGEVTESVLLHPIDQIHTSISSCILTTAIDFLPYHIVLDMAYQCTYNVKISINQAFIDFQHENQNITNSYPRLTMISAQLLTKSTSLELRSLIPLDT